jgi:hypothetical protein
MPKQPLAQILQTFNYVREGIMGNLCRRQGLRTKASDIELDLILSLWIADSAHPDLARKIVAQAQIQPQANRYPATMPTHFSEPVWWAWVAAFPAAFALGLSLGFWVTLTHLEAGENQDEQAHNSNAYALYEESDRL